MKTTVFNRVCPSLSVCVRVCLWIILAVALSSCATANITTTTNADGSSSCTASYQAFRPSL